MGKGIHYGRAQTRNYTYEYQRINAKSFISLLASPLGQYQLNGIKKTPSHRQFTLKECEGWGRVMVFNFNGKEIPIPLKTDSRSASNKLFLICPYCAKSRQHLYALRSTFSCRECAGLHYASQSEGQRDRLARKIRKMRIVLWGVDIPEILSVASSCEFWPKPDNTHWKTFEKKKANIKILENQYRFDMSVFIHRNFSFH